ncbi:MAG: cytidine deaminase, partial [Ferruginibacter sp.]
MNKEKYQFSYDVYNSAADLSEADAELVKEAREITTSAYAPYSKFNVGAVARLVNGELIAGTNQENASYPVGICAERVLLSSAATLHPNIAIDTIAISYDNTKGKSDHPISPC